MSSTFQTIIALGLVAVATASLIYSAVKKRRSPGCGSEGCGAISPEVKKLQARLKR